MLTALGWLGISSLCGETKNSVAIDAVPPPPPELCAGRIAEVGAPIERLAAGNRVFASGKTLVWTTWSAAEKRTTFYASGSPPKLLATYAGAVSDLRADDSALYFATDRSILRIPLTGGIPASIQRAASSIYKITLAREALYWVEYDSNRKRGRVMTSSTRGGQVRILASLGDMDLGVQEIALDEDGTLYWLATKKLMVLRKDEKAPIVDAEHVDAFAVDASYVYFSGSLEADRGKLRRHVKPSGPTETVVPRYWRADHSMRVVGDYVYGTQNAWRMKSAHPAYLVRARKTGGCTEIVTTLPNDNFNDIYADDTRLYWADSTKGEILTIPVR